MTPQVQVKRNEELPVAQNITLVQSVSLRGKEIRGCHRSAATGKRTRCH